MTENEATSLHWEDKNGRIIWANDAELDLLGYTAEEYIGCNSAEFYVDPETRDEIRERLARHEIIENYPTRLRCKNSSIKNVLITTSVTQEDGQFIHIRFSTRDVTAYNVADEIQARLSAVVKYSDDAIVTKTLDGIIVSWNTGASSIFGYTEEEVLGQSIRILFPPDRLHEEEEFLERLSRGEHIDHYETVRVRKDGQQINISVTLSPIRNATGQVIGASKIARDITKRKRNEQRINLLLELSSAFSQALRPKQIAQLMIEQGVQALGASAGALAMVIKGGTSLEILYQSGLSDENVQQAGATPFAFLGPLNDAVRTDALVWIETVEQYNAQYPELANGSQQNGSRSVICIPLKVDARVIGGLCFIFPTEKRFDPEEANFYKTLAYLCVQSLERTRLYESERRERRLAEALRDAAVSLSSTWDLSEVLDQILNTIDRVVDHNVADVMLIEDGVAQIVRSHGYAESGIVKSEQEMQNFSLKIDETYHMKWVAENKRPTIIQDTQLDKTWIKAHEKDIIRSTLIVPIVSANSVIGFLNVNRFVPNGFSAKDAERLSTFADYAAIAIRNAQFYHRDLELATQEERQRIARDLHDSVSQTLFSASIIAGVLPQLWESNTDKARVQTQALNQLTRNAVAEMRVLLVELRPESLVKTYLKSLLTQLGYALLGRQEIMFNFIEKVSSEQLLPPDVQIAFYRIVQESLNNTIKHGQATQVRIRFFQTDSQVRIAITDNGRGFDTSAVFGSIGLKSMQERANKNQISLRIKSTVGRGTQVKLVWTA